MFFPGLFLHQGTTDGYLRPSEVDSLALVNVNIDERVFISNDIKFELQKINTQLIKIQKGLCYEVNSLNSQVDELTTEDIFPWLKCINFKQNQTLIVLLLMLHSSIGRVKRISFHNYPQQSGNNCTGNSFHTGVTCLINRIT